MKSIGIRWYIIILTTININVFAQSAEFVNCLSRADFLFSLRQYKPAIKEYQRFIFYTQIEDIDILMKIANGLYQMHDYEIALKYYDKIYYQSNDPEIKFKCRYHEIAYHIKENSYNEALTVLFSLDSSYYRLYPHVIDFLTGICYFGLENFNESEKYILKIISDNPKATQEIQAIFSSKRMFYKPNPSAISKLSLILPGIGQIITGEIKEGLNSLVLVEGIGILAVLVGIRYSFLDSVLSVMPWYQRYLLGGAEKAEKLSIEKRKKNRNKIYLKTLDVLEQYSQDFELLN